VNHAKANTGKRVSVGAPDLASLLFIGVEGWAGAG
jgi:hypothetical protein